MNDIVRRYDAEFVQSTPGTFLPSPCRPDVVVPRGSRVEIVAINVPLGRTVFDYWTGAWAEPGKASGATCVLSGDDLLTDRWTEAVYRFTGIPNP